MPRSAAAIQAEINILEAELASAGSINRSLGSDGVSVTKNDIIALQSRLDKLYIQLERAEGKGMFVRGVVRGL